MNLRSMKFGTYGTGFERVKKDDIIDNIYSYK